MLTSVKTAHSCSIDNSYCTIAKDGLYYIHPMQNHSFTPREAARLQSLRDSYIFSGCRTSVHRQMGNTVPPSLAKAVAEKVIARL
ncbi:MAG: DNA cytosine methyltransferase [Candidatus Thorarchaeota archaeon]